MNSLRVLFLFGVLFAIHAYACHGAASPSRHVKSEEELDKEAFVVFETSLNEAKDEDPKPEDLTKAAFIKRFNTSERQLMAFKKLAADGNNTALATLIEKILNKNE